MTEPVTEQLHRRQEAAARMPPLADGRRDPLEPATPRQYCCECGARAADAAPLGLVVVAGRTKCRDRVDCWQRKCGHKPSR